LPATRPITGATKPATDRSTAARKPDQRPPGTLTSTDNHRNRSIRHVKTDLTTGSVDRG
jgi:hypothetical protein